MVAWQCSGHVLYSATSALLQSRFNHRKMLRVLCYFTFRVYLAPHVNACEAVPSTHLFKCVFFSEALSQSCGGQTSDEQGPRPPPPCCSLRLLPQTCHIDLLHIFQLLSHVTAVWSAHPGGRHHHLADFFQFLFCIIYDIYWYWTFLWL